MIRAAAFAAAFVVCASHVTAQTPAPRQARPVALVGATIHPVSGPVIPNGTIVFDNGVITAVGANVTVPANAERVDVTGKHIYPGIVSAGSQIGLFEIGAVDVTVDVNELGPFNPNVRAEVAFHPESRHIGTTRSNGVLVTVTTPGGGIISGQPAAMMLDGWTWESMLLKSKVGLTINWPGSNNENQYQEQLSRLRDFFDEARAYRTMVSSHRGYTR